MRPLILGVSKFRSRITDRIEVMKLLLTDKSIRWFKNKNLILRISVVIFVWNSAPIFESVNVINMLQQVYKSLPDDKPITAISIVEDASKCPPGFYVVSNTL